MSAVNFSTVTVRLDPRRVEQLKSLAAALGTTSAGVIAQVLRDRIADGTIPPDIPGIVVRAVDGGVSIKIDGAEPFIYSRDVAREIAAALASVADGGTGVVSIDHNFSVVRQGTGIKVSLPFSGAQAVPFKLAPSFPPDLAKDLGGLIHQAAA